MVEGANKALNSRANRSSVPPNKRPTPLRAAHLRKLTVAQLTPSPALTPQLAPRASPRPNASHHAAGAKAEEQALQGTQTSGRR